MNNKELLSNKFSLMISTMYSDKDIRFFKELDTLLVHKRFDNAYELSLTENFLHVSLCNLTFKNIKKIILNCIKMLNSSNICDQRSLYEIAKLSNLPKKKLEKSIDSDLHNELIRTLDLVSRETTLLSFDFLTLRIVDNFLLCHMKNDIAENYELLRKRLIEKIVNFNHEHEKREKETTFLCWIDRILVAVEKDEITTDDFISLSRKLFDVTTATIYMYWKVLHSTNYLLLQPKYNDSDKLKKFRKELFKIIGEKYGSVNTNCDDVKDLAISTLAKKNVDKEDHYYLYDTIKLTSIKNEENKLYCLKICKYLIYHNMKQNIFSYRFIRKYFIETLFEIIDNPINNIQIKIEEMSVMIALFHVDSYFCFNRFEIFAKLVNTLKSINNGEYRPTYKNFYRFCSVLDYIMSENPDIEYPEIINFLSHRKSDKEIIATCFKLTEDKLNH